MFAEPFEFAALCLKQVARVGVEFRSAAHCREDTAAKVVRKSQLSRLEIAAQLPLAHKELHRASLYENALGRGNFGCVPTTISPGKPYGFSKVGRTIADFAWEALCLTDAIRFE